VEGVTEGLAVFLAADCAPPPLVRDYGTFGPRRPDAQSGGSGNPQSFLNGTWSRSAIIIGLSQTGSCVKVTESPADFHADLPSP